MKVNEKIISDLSLRNDTPVLIVDEDHPKEGYTNIPLYYQLNNDEMYIIAAPYDGEIVYFIDDEWYKEEEALEILKL